MAFTYGEDLTDNSDFVRFHTHDTIESEHQLSDAIITSLLATQSSKERAVIAGLKYKLQNLIRPDVKAGWMSVTEHREAVQSMQDLINIKESELGLTGYTGTATYTYRVDSAADEEPYG